MHEWLIVGGGIHGTILSLALTTRGKVDRDDLCIVDPNPEPLAMWRKHTRACGMKFLRSPGSHSVEPDFAALRRWATARGYGAADFILPYFRPSLRLFEAHSSHVVSKHRLAGLTRTDRVVSVVPDNGALSIVCESGERVASRRVVLAVGRTDRQRIPGWAKGLGARVRHVFGAPHSPVSSWAEGRVVVVGGGITAAQCAISCVEEGASVDSVVMVSPHDLRVSLFDSEPCYIGPRCLPGFLALSTVEEKQAELQRVRYPGSVPPYIAGELAAAESTGGVERVVGEVESVTTGDPMVMRLSDGRRIQADTIVLATGFEGSVPAPSLIAQIADAFDAATDDRGYPVPNIDLEWAGRDTGVVYVTGVLGELALGPTAGNIIGAHIAGRRLIAGSGNRLPWTWASAAALASSRQTL